MHVHVPLRSAMSRRPALKDREGITTSVQTVASIAAWVVLCTIGLSGLLKLSEIGAFQRSLHSWSLLPAWSVPVVTVVVPLVEFLVLAVWLLRLVEQRRMLMVVFGILTTFTLLYIAHLAFAQRPNCNCFGILMRHAELMRSSWMHLAVNSTLLCMTVFAFHYARRSA